MDSIYALRLVRAVKKSEPGGDFIDHGWSLVKALDAAGFDILPRDPIKKADRRTTLNDMCGLNREPRDD